MIGPFQNEFLGPFVLKQPTKRQEAFDEILGIDAWRKTFKNTSTLQAAVKSKIEVLTVEIAGKEEQAATLPEREQELRDILPRPKEFREEAEKETALADVHKQSTSFDAREKRSPRGGTETQVLENRIYDGQGKINDQKKRVEEAEKAVKPLKKTARGKEAFDAAESKLKSLREQEKQRRMIEKEINLLDRECSRLSQALEHESGEVEKTATQLRDEENRLRKALKEISEDESKVQQAARLPELRKEADSIRSRQGLLGGRRAGLQEGKEAGATRSSGRIFSRQTSTGWMRTLTPSSRVKTTVLL